MTTIETVTTEHLPEPVKARFWREAVCDALVELDVSDVSDSDFDAKLSLLRAGDAAMCEISSTRQHVARTRRHIGRKTAAYFHLPCQIDGTSYLQQCGRTFVLAPGDFAVFDSTEPYELAFSGSFRQLVVQVPKDWLRQELAMRGFVGGLRLDGRNPLTRLAFRYLRNLFDESPAIDHDLHAVLLRQSMDLISTAANAAITEHFGSASPSRRALTARIQRHMDDQLTNPHLSLDEIARVFAISKRTLHEVFAAFGTTPQRWILERRLARCRSDLRNPAFASSSIMEIALRWGFNSPAHFARSYREHFRLPPSLDRKPI
ncbi:helix-turn-helix domain-containing protein [Bradyrhizobium tropiciagri]|uniref:AraC-like ligand-binding domain-containing protein n=1 Tax=Bradyrhizobium tropiciagri TaxID=312253 RepID=UPI001BABACDA|nr:helix-turn-helix domain-containing protein [Bradyrhizobium tropiciagri]MBR0896756.1 helix-turn-helix domain-containing protein [Bradyrhizobium tropiciagri]